MFTNISYGSHQGKHQNIDMCSVQENSAWVIDGANSLFPAHISNEESDADWFVKEFNAYLKTNLKADGLPITEIMKLAMADIHDRFKQFSGYDALCDMELPSGACAAVCTRGKNINYFVLGCCEIVITYDNGEMISLSDLRLQELDGKLLEISQMAKKKRRLPLYQAREFMDTMMVENRLRRNRPEGYFVLGEDVDAADEAITGSIPSDHIKTISLICNGFSQYYNCKKVEKNLWHYLNEKRNALLVETYDELLVRQPVNKKIARYMIEKMSGQSTIVTFSISNMQYLSNKNEKNT